MDLALRPSSFRIALVATAAVAFAACDSSEGADAGRDVATDRSVGTQDSGSGEPDTGTETDASSPSDRGDAATGSIYVRIAHLSSTAPAVKICVKPASGTFSASDTPVTPSLSFPSVTTYLQLPVGAYRARIVAATATNCATGVGDDITLPTGLAAGTYATVAAIGLFGVTAGPTAFQVRVFADLPATPASGTAHVRFIHAAPGTNVPVWVGVPGGATGWASGSPLFANVNYAGTSANAGTDPTLAATNGFRPLSGAPISALLAASAMASGTSFAWRSNGTVAIPSRAILSVFAIDRTGGVDVFACDDTYTAATAGPNTTCAVVPRQ